MNIIKNEKKIKRNGLIGQWISIAALIILGTGMYLTFSKPEFFTYSLLALVTGFTFTQIGMYMGNRWGRSPRPDEQLDAGLKGLTSEFSIYHYTTPASHLLVGPAGIWVLLPYRQSGKVAYIKNRWKLMGGGFLQSYMSIFGQEGIGRPEFEMASEISAVEKLLKKKLNQTDLPAIQGALIFTNDKIEIESNGAPETAMQINKLKGFIRQKAKEKTLSSFKIIEITEALK